MRAVAQRVKSASVSCGGHLISSIGRGLLILLGIDEGDGNADLSYICDKIIGLRVFDDQSGNMNLSGGGHRRRGFDRISVYPVRRLQEGPPPQLYKGGKARQGAFNVRGCNPTDR